MADAETQGLAYLLREAEIVERQLALVRGRPTDAVIASFRLRLDSLDRQIRLRAAELRIDVAPLVELRRALGRMSGQAG